MSKAIYICTRNRSMGPRESLRIHEICRKLTPDILMPSVKHRVSVSGKIAWGVVNDNPCLVQKGDSLMLGLLYEKSTRWDEPCTAYPDGSYAIFRCNEEYFEIVSDPAASRTVWYYLDDEVFIASTSQRAIVSFLGNFIFDERVIPWMLSSGSLGPEYSWDRRLKRLGSDCSLLLDRNSWRISQKQAVIEFAEVKRTAAEHEELLTAAIRNTIRSLDTGSLKTWVLPLSGGHDSRALLCFIAELEGAPASLQTLTWGLEASIRAKNNDASIAKQLAQHFGFAHQYYHTDSTKSEPIEAVIERFIVCGEGRVDHLAGYMDGFQLWRKLNASGINGIIRGDHAFGSKAASTPAAVRRSVGCALCGDFSNLEHVIRDFDLCPQALPVNLEIKEGESLQQWGNRLRYVHRIPAILAALSDLKAAFVEQANPLLSRDILELARQLPDHLTADKVLFKSVVEKISPHIPYARSAATEPAAVIFGRPDMVQLLRSQIDSDGARRVFKDGFVQFILDGFRMAGPESERWTRPPSRKLRSFIPQFMRKGFRHLKPKPSLDGNLLAFRMFLVVRMQELLRTDVNDMGLY